MTPREPTADDLLIVYADHDGQHHLDRDCDAKLDTVWMHRGSWLNTTRLPNALERDLTADLAVVL